MHRLLHRSGHLHREMIIPSSSRTAKLPLVSSVCKLVKSTLEGRCGQWERKTSKADWHHPHHAAWPYFRKSTSFLPDPSGNLL